MGSSNIPMNTLHNSNTTLDDDPPAYYATIYDNRLSEHSSTNKEQATMSNSYEPIITKTENQRNVKANQLSGQPFTNVNKINKYDYEEYSESTLPGLMITQKQNRFENLTNNTVYSYSHNPSGKIDLVNSDSANLNNKVIARRTRQPTHSVGRSASLNDIYDSTVSQPAKACTGNVYNTLKTKRGTETNYDVSRIKHKPVWHNTNYCEVKRTFSK